jgi:hypothetical protein
VFPSAVPSYALDAVVVPWPRYCNRVIPWAAFSECVIDVCVFVCVCVCYEAGKWGHASSFNPTPLRAQHAGLTHGLALLARRYWLSSTVVSDLHACIDLCRSNPSCACLYYSVSRRVCRPLSSASLTVLAPVANPNNDLSYYRCVCV